MHLVREIPRARGCIKMDIWIISAILLLTLYLLITEKISVDLTAIGIMVLLVVSRILTPKEAIGGFANPAVITGKPDNASPPARKVQKVMGILDFNPPMLRMSWGSMCLPVCNTPCSIP